MQKYRSLAVCAINLESVKYVECNRVKYKYSKNDAGGLSGVWNERNVSGSNVFGRQQVRFGG